LIRKLVWLLGLLALSVLGTIHLARDWLQQPLSYQEAIVLEVESGDHLSAVLGKLESLQVLEHRWLASLYGRYYQYDRRVKAGEYLLEPGLTLSSLFELLSSGKSIQYSVRFIEGWRISDMHLEIDSHPKLVREIISWDPAALAAELGFDMANAEGQFFPDTYFYHKGMSDKQILLTANERLRNVLQDAWSSRSESVAVKTPYEALILASIVEKETGKLDERDLIAGVFTRRLMLGMRLQTDPTVIYGLGNAFDGNLTRKHLQQSSPYNTYVIDGLPPAPIALASEAAIRASLNPKDEGYLFFVAKGDGSHVFSKTLEEHNQAVKAFQLKKNDQYRSY
jgi:UPF0755 protein